VKEGADCGLKVNAERPDEQGDLALDNRWDSLQNEYQKFNL
jgi:hypothetical protein